MAKNLLLLRYARFELVQIVRVAFLYFGNFPLELLQFLHHLVVLALNTRQYTVRLGDKLREDFRVLVVFGQMWQSVVKIRGLPSLNYHSLPGPRREEP